MIIPKNISTDYVTAQSLWH